MHTETSILSIPVSVEGGELYILAAWAKGIELGNGGVGLICNSPTQLQVPAFDGMGGYYPTPDWTLFATVVTTPNDSSQCQLYLQNYRTTGEVLFDGILWVRIPRR